MTDYPDSLFDRARRVSPAEVARAHGAVLFKRGKKARGECPICHGGKRSEAFMADEEGPIWHCFLSCGTGDSVALEMALGGHPDRVSAARVLAGEAERIVRERPRREKVAAEPSPIVDSGEVAAYIAARMRPATGTIVEAWFRARGIDPGRIGVALTRLGFLAACPVSPWRVGRAPDDWRCNPAMIAPLRETDGGPVVGIHATYLSADGRRKAALARRDGSPIAARKMFGQARHAGCFLSPIDAPGPLVAGEGLETVLTYTSAFAGPSRALAVLSLDNLSGRARRDDDGALPLWNLRADPAGAPMTIPHAGEVHLLIDADMKPVAVKAQLMRRGRREKIRLDALRRAEISATLAVQAWRAAGAGPVKAMRAPVGMDFNDLGRAA